MAESEGEAGPFAHEVWFRAPESFTLPLATSTGLHQGKALPVVKTDHRFMSTNEKSPQMIVEPGESSSNTLSTRQTRNNPLMLKRTARKLVPSGPEGRQGKKGL